MEEAKRCELKIKRTARIRCGGCVPTGALAPRNSTEKENIPSPVRRSARIRGMKRRDYKEASPEPKDYGGSDYSDDRSPSSWAAAGRDDDDLDEQPKERTPEGPNGDGNDGNESGNNNGGGDDGGDDGETMAMKTPSDCIRCVVELAVNPSGISTRRLMNVSKPWKR
jgi:hypothetical protein